jgi:hypothetical protein
MNKEAHLGFPLEYSQKMATARFWEKNMEHFGHAVICSY